MLRWIFIVLAHWNSSLWVDMWLDSDTLLWFRACYSVLLQCCVLCEEVANTNSIVFDLTQILNPKPTPFEASTLSSPSLYSLISGYLFLCSPTGHHVRDRMVVTFTTTYAISAYHHWRRALESRSWRGVLNTILCDNVGQWFMTGQWFSLGALVSSTNKTDRHYIAEILLKVALNTITPTPNLSMFSLLI